MVIVRLEFGYCFAHGVLLGKEETLRQQPPNPSWDLTLPTVAIEPGEYQEDRQAALWRLILAYGIAG
jgi:hypothetical protein